MREISAFTCPGLAERISTRSAVLMASARSWVIRMAVFFVSLMIVAMSSHTVSLVW